MQHRRRLLIFQAAKRAAFNHQAQCENKHPVHQEVHNKLFMVVETNKQYSH